jgi:putative ABC transport system permease protein
MGRVRFAFRSLAKAPVLCLAVVLSLGLGIGGNTAIFSLLHQVVLSALPIPHPEQIVLLTAPGEFKRGSTSDNDSGNMDYIFNWHTFRELEKHGEAADVIGFRIIGSNVGYDRQTITGSMMLVSGDYFRVLGVEPLVGRLIARQDDVPGGGNPVAVLGYHYWRETLGGNTSVLNQTVKVNGQPFTIVGIVPPNFSGTTIGSEPSLYLPMSFKPLLTEGWNGTDRLNDYWVYLLARLKPGVTRQQAETALNVPYHAVVEEMATTLHGPTEQSPRFREQKLSLKEGSRGNSYFRTEYQRPLLILMLATGLVLLIAMANAANLLLARSIERRKELSIRAAMGAGRGELILQLLTEALLLAATGGIVGLAMAFGGLRLLLSWWGGDVPPSLANTNLSWPVLLFSLALSLATGLLFGLYPAWEASRTSLATRLSEESATSFGSRGSARLRKALVCAQLSISIILLIPTGMFLKSLINLLHVDLGIRTANVVGFRITPSSNGYAPAKRMALFERVESELGAIPGVRSVAASMVPLLDNSNWSTSFYIEGLPHGANRPNSHSNYVGPRFFSKAGIPLIGGREILETDTAASPKVAVVNEAFVKEFLNGQNPIGHRLGFEKEGAFDTEIVGIVKDSHYASVRQQPPPTFYLPWRQSDIVAGMSFYVRSELPPKQIVPAIRSVMRSIDSDVPLEQMRTMEEQVHFNLRQDELMLRLAAVFAVLATILAMLGLYGVMAYGVACRTREIGVRMALGAAPARICSMIMGEWAWIVAIGVGFGIPVALACVRLIASQLFGVDSKDVIIPASAALILACTAGIAAYWPARRASRVNPLEALRHD